MPTYEFRCPTGHEFEKFYRSIGGAPSEVRCPTCGKTAERLMSAGGGLVFKGSGFYITDYGKDGKKSQAPRSTESSTSSTESGTKSEAGAPDAKPPAEQKPATAAKSEDSKSSAPKSEATNSPGKTKSAE
jgi:putative FmdB family regulatory protein